MQNLRSDYRSVSRGFDGKRCVRFVLHAKLQKERDGGIWKKKKKRHVVRLLPTESGRVVSYSREQGKGQRFSHFGFTERGTHSILAEFGRAGKGRTTG